MRLRISTYWMVVFSLLWIANLYHLFIFLCISCFFLFLYRSSLYILDTNPLSVLDICKYFLLICHSQIKTLRVLCFIELKTIIINLINIFFFNSESMFLGSYLRNYSTYQSYKDIIHFLSFVILSFTFRYSTSLVFVYKML